MYQSPEPLEGMPLIAPSTTDHPLYEQVVEACKTVYDPEIPVNIYELGLIYTIEINDDNDIRVAMSLTAPGCPVAGDMLKAAPVCQPAKAVLVRIHHILLPPEDTPEHAQDARAFRLNQMQEARTACGVPLLAVPVDAVATRQRRG